MKELSNNTVTREMRSNIGIRVPFTADEAKEFNKYINKHCLRKGAFIRSVLLSAIREGKDE